MRSLVHASVVAVVSCAVASSSEAVWAPTEGPEGVSIVAVSYDGAANRVYLAGGLALYRSDDDGLTWEDISSSSGPTNINDVYAHPGGPLLVGVSLRGVWWSTNGGDTWDFDQITHNPHTGLGASIAAVAITSNGAWLASSFRSTTGGASWTEMSIYGNAFATLSGTTLAGTSDGVYASANGGVTWNASNVGIEGQYVQDLAVDAGGRAYAAAYGAGVFRSDDGGASWVPASTGLGSLVVSGLASDPAGRLYAATAGAGVFVSDDQAMSWAPSPGSVPDLQTTAITTMGATGVLTGAASGVVLSPDQGATWEPRNHDLTTRSLDVLAFATSGTGVLGSLGGGTYRSTDGGGSWIPALEGLESRLVTAIVETPAAALLSATWTGVYRSTDDAGSWTPSGVPGERIVDLGVAPDGTVYAVAQVMFDTTTLVFRSDDDGVTWSPVLEPSDLALPSALGRVVLDGGGRVFVGGSSFVAGGLVLVSEDQGATWVETTCGSPGSSVVDMGVDAADAVYALTVNPAGLFVTEDLGATWIEIALPDPGQAACMTVAPSGELWIGTTLDGVFRSDDGGASWTAFNDGFGPSPPRVSEIAVHDMFVYAGTDAEGLFRSPSDPAVAVPDVSGIDRERLALRPNPFTAQVTIGYDVGKAGATRIDVFGVDGRHVRRLLDDARPAGRGHVVWDGRDAAGRRVAPGTYVLRVETPGAETSRLVTLMR